MKTTWILICSFFILQLFPSLNALDVTQFGAIGDGVTDDSEAFLRVWEAVCTLAGAENKLEVPAGKTFMLQPLKFEGPCKSTQIFVQISGKLIAPSKKQWKGDDDSQWILFSSIDGLTINGNGEINGQGSDWWGKDSRPTALQFRHCNNLKVSGLKHVDSPKAHIHLNDCNSVAISGLHIIAPESSPNTDGIDISRSTDVTIRDSVIATGDDCIAISNGTSNINIAGIDCGPGHGISIGSLGKDGSMATVENVCVQNCSFTGTTNGARIKTWQGGSGYVRRVVFQGIRLDNVKNPIIIDQNYCLKGEKCKTNQKSAVALSKILYSDFVGTSKSEVSVAFQCSESVPCSEIFMSNVKITSIKGNIAPGECDNVKDSTSTSAMSGLECLAVVPNVSPQPAALGISSGLTCLLPLLGPSPPSAPETVPSVPSAPSVPSLPSVPSMPYVPVPSVPYVPVPSVPYGPSEPSGPSGSSESPDIEWTNNGLRLGVHQSIFVSIFSSLIYVLGSKLF